MMLVDRSDEKKWCHRASMRSTSCSGKTTVPSGSTSNSGACANRASSGQLEDARHPCITRGQWGGMPRPWRPTAGSCRRRQARAMKGRRITLKAELEPFFDFWSVIQQHAEPNTLPSWKSTFCNSTRTRRALRHPSISRQTYRRDKVGPPNPQANHESCVSFPFRAEITRPELPDPPP